MTNYSFFGVTGNGANGPGSSTSFSGGIVLGAVFEVTSPGYSLLGYGFWRADTSQAASASCALWQGTGLNTGTLTASSTASLSSMTAGAWNYVTLGTPIALTQNQVYKAQIGLVNNFPFTVGQFGTGGAYSAGIVNGPLTCFSDITANGGTNPDTYHDDQATYATGSSDPTAAYVTSINGSFNGWVDVLIGLPPAPPPPAAYTAAMSLM